LTRAPASVDTRAVSLPRVLFVSKPVVPPFHDGTKCLVRDVATRIQRVAPVVMATPDAPPLDGGNVELESVYGESGQYSPALLENIRAATFLVTRAHADLWHFVFAPNPRTSRVGGTLKRLRGVPVVQTIASPPRDFAHVDRLLFGDRVVAQSAWTRDQVNASERARGLPERRVDVIHPPVGPIAPRSIEAKREVRRALSIPDAARFLVYPGDLEVSSGAERVAALAEALQKTLPEVVVVFAYRAKTPRAPELAKALEARLPKRSVRFTETLPDVLALIEDASAVLFPVDDLWGKVDLPIVLLESMRLGVPIVALRAGPLAELGGVVHFEAEGELERSVVELLGSPDQQRRVAEEQRRWVEAECAAEVVARRYEGIYLEMLEKKA
jgi:glycosyltransferase involved in cell wall biosynthesis